VTSPWCVLYVQAVVKKAQEAKRRPTVEELGASVTDSTFLNALQKDVSRWIKEIQKVRGDRGIWQIPAHLHSLVCALPNYMYMWVIGVCWSGWLTALAIRDMYMSSLVPVTPNKGEGYLFSQLVALSVSA